MLTFSKKAILLVLLALCLLLGIGSAALAASWSDLDSGILMGYGLTTDQIAQVSQGYPDGTWQPWRGVTQGQFLKMAKAGFNTDAVDLTGLGFSDEWAPVTRLQAIGVLARLVADGEGYDLKTLAESDVTAALDAFGDAGTIGANVKKEVAFAVLRSLVKGNNQHLLLPGTQLTRIVAAAFIVRAMGPQLRVDDTENGATMTVKVGDIIQVVLKGNPTTGYTWTAALSEQDESILEQMGEYDYVSDSGLIGSGGTFTFRFKALKAGEATLKLVYSRPWESVQPLETFSMTVKVAEKPLEGTAWRLEGWTLSSLNPADFEITASFADGRVGGKAAVNSYSGPYVVGKNGFLSVGAIVSTKMAGPEPAMRAESAYFQLLQEAKGYRLIDGHLTLLDANGNESLIFKPAA